MRKFKLVQIHLSLTRWLDPDFITVKILDIYDVVPLSAVLGRKKVMTEDF